MNEDIRDVIVIGSGPAGYTAAVYTARAQLRPLVFEGAQSGGALMNTTEVENYPGFRQGVQGPDLMDEMRAQAERFGADIRTEDVTSVQLDTAIKVVRVGDVDYRSRTVILAMGSAYKELGVPGEAPLAGHGVSWCATCDGFFFKGHDIVVVGGGDTAMEEATFLSRFANSITIVHRRDTLRASKIMQERAQADPKISFVWDSEVAQILGAGKVDSVRLRSTIDGSQQTLPVTGVFVAIGHDPRSALVRGQVRLDEDGYVLVDPPTTQTNLAGVFAAGDLVDHTYRQAVTAAGTGCAAALDAERYLAAQASPEPLAAASTSSASHEFARPAPSAAPARSRQS